MNIGTYVYVQIHIYVCTSIIFTLLLTAFQLKKGEEVKAIPASGFHLLQLNLGCNRYFPFKKER